MSNRIANCAALAGLVAMMLPVFPMTAAPASGCARAFATEIFAKRDDQAGRPDTLRPMPMPCDLGDGGCQDTDRANPAGSDG